MDTKMSKYDRYLQKFNTWKQKEGKSKINPTRMSNSGNENKPAIKHAVKAIKDVKGTSEETHRMKHEKKLKNTVNLQSSQEMRLKLAEWREEQEHKKKETLQKSKKLFKPSSVTPIHPSQKRSASVLSSSGVQRPNTESVKVPRAVSALSDVVKPTVSSSLKKSASTLNKPKSYHLLKKKDSHHRRCHLGASKPSFKKKSTGSAIPSDSVKPSILKRRRVIHNGVSCLESETNKALVTAAETPNRRLSYTISKEASFLATNISSQDLLDYSMNSERIHNLESTGECTKDLEDMPRPSVSMDISVASKRSVRFKSPEIFLCASKKAKVHTPMSTPSRFSTPRKEMSQREKLNKWLESRGKTPTSYRHLHCFCGRNSSKKEKPIQRRRSSSTLCAKPATPSGGMPQPVPPSFSEPSNVCDQLDSMLDECNTLFEAGCPVDAILPWMDSILTSIPAASQSARYFIIKAKLLEGMAGDDTILDLFEQAVRNKAKPAEMLADTLKDFVEKMASRRQATMDAAHTPAKPRQHRKSGMEAENMFASSAVKYMYCETTPFFKKIRSCTDIALTPHGVVTPVRRSTRRSISSLPRMLQDHDTVVDSLNDLDEVKRGTLLFNDNTALTDGESKD